MRQDDYKALVRVPQLDVDMSEIPNGQHVIRVRQGVILSVTPADLSGKPIGKVVPARKRESSINVAKWSDKRRICFAVETSAFGRLMVAERFLPLEGAKNFRDLGGYRTRGGKHIRWGQVFRSAALNRLSDLDGAYLRESVGIKTICDFRGNAERSASPNIIKWMSSSAMTTLLSIEADNSKIMSPTAISSGLGNFYVDLIDTRGADIIKPFLMQMLDSSRMPLVFHCTAGKDRTGVASAVLLSLLGVPDDTIIADYSLTNLATPTLIAEMEQNPKYAPLLKSNRSMMLRLLTADPAWMDQMLKHVQSKYGGMERYALDTLDLSRDNIEQLRQRLLA